MNWRKWQAWALRLTGAVELLALPAAVMPRAWMDAAHGWLGLAELPRGPVVDSLLREVSFTYGLHGVGLWIIASDVARFRPLVVWTGIGYLLAGMAFVPIELLVGLPWYWALGNGGSCLAVGLVVLGLLWGEARARKAPAATDAPPRS